METCRVTGISLPTNSTIGISEDKLLRRLDCAVIETAHQINREVSGREFDSVKGVFGEGVELYPDAGFRKRIIFRYVCVTSNCIKGFFCLVN